MEIAGKIRLAKSHPWILVLASLLPLWLLSLAVMAEGFPKPPLPIELAFGAFLLAILTGVILLGIRWITAELLLYSLSPLAFLFAFDEITTTIKTPFIILSALILTAGILFYHRTRSGPRRWLVLTIAIVITLFLAGNAADNFWSLHADLGIGECFMDAAGCPPLPADATPWWKLFFSF